MVSADVVYFSSSGFFPSSLNILFAILRGVAPHAFCGGTSLSFIMLFIVSWSVSFASLSVK